MLILGGCSPSQKEWRHPITELQPAEDEVNHRLNLSNNSLISLPFFFDTTSIEQTISINSRTRVEDEFYEQPNKVDIDSNGFIYISHRWTNTIQVYNQKGEPEYKIGKSGRGPGELMDLISFELDDESNRLYMLDAFEIEVYERIGERFEYANSITLKFQSSFDMCKLGNYLYVSGINIDKRFLKKVTLSGISVDERFKKGADYNVSYPITRIDLSSFEPDTTFGYLYHSANRQPVTAGFLSETLLDCNEQTNILLAYQKHFSFIFGYDPDGNRNWLSKLDNYMSMEHIENSKDYGPGHFPHTNEGLYQYKYRLRTLPESRYSLLQISHFKPQKYFGDPEHTPLPEYNYRSILVDSETGELFNSDLYDIILYKDSSTVITTDFNFPNNEFRLFKHILR